MSKGPRKKALKAAWKTQERQNLITSIPMPHDDLRALFDYLDREDAPQCDHTLCKTTGFLHTRGLDVEHVLIWLHQHGGYCDCEVIYNVEEKFGPLVGRRR